MRYVRLFFLGLALGLLASLPATAQARPKLPAGKPVASARQQRRTAAQRAMEQEWQTHAHEWAPGIVVPYSAAQRWVFFGKVYDWAAANDLTGCRCVAKTGALLLRTKCYGWAPEDTDQAMRYMEDDDPDAALQWLEYSFDQ